MVVKENLNQDKRKIKLIFIFLALFSFSIGIWENYKSVWLEINKISIAGSSYIISAGLILTCFISIGIMFLFKNYNLVALIKTSVILRFISLTALCILFQFSINWLKIIFFILDAISTNLVIISIYPLLTQTVKNNKAYSHRKLIEYVFADFGILIAGIIISFSLANFFEYNILVIIAIILTVCSIPLAFMFHSDNSEKSVNVKRVFKDKITNIYLLYIFIQQMAYNTALGLQTLLLKNVLGLSMQVVSIFLLVASISGDTFGCIALYKLNFKNDYISYSCKFVLRFIVYILIVITANIYIAIVAIFLSLFVSRAWENVSDGVYINRVAKEDQLFFNNIRYAFNKLGCAIGVLISGALFNYGLRAIFGVSCAIMLISISLAFTLIHMRKKEQNNIKQ